MHWHTLNRTIESMTFEDWMEYRGLSSSSVKKYEGAIRGALSEWAREGGLIEGPLTGVTSKSAFDAISLGVQKLPIFVERNERGHNMYSSALAKFAEYLSEGYENDVEGDVESIVSSSSLGATEKSNLVKARIGQGVFRQKLIAYWGACAVTGFKETGLLVASHIKPWSASSDAERLDPFNGLLLIPNLDRAFDAGYITFSESGKIQLSPLLSEPNKLGIEAGMEIVLSPKHQSFLKFHREEVFRAS